MKDLIPPVDTPDKLFHDGDPLTGELGTIVSALLMNNLQAAVRSSQNELISIIRAASPDAVLDEATTNQVLTALNKLFLLAQNNLVEIKTAGEAAQSSARANLGLLSASLRAVGTGTNQIPDMAAFNLNSINCFRLPTGHIVQVGGGVTVNGGFTQSYQVPFPNQCLALIGTVYGLTGQRLFVATNTSDRTAANMNVVNTDGSGVNVSVGYIAIGR